ncbi:MAG TPA: hypothetical protein VF094_05260 [Gaiellaceae bacterium]
MAGGIGRSVHLAAVFVLVALTAALPAGAAEATSPTAITGPAQQVGPTSAVVNGTVNPSGKSTTAFFEYGSDPSQLTKSATTNVGAGTSDVAVSTKLTGLSPGTTYTYLVEATNSDGTAKGVEGTFTTLSPPGVVTGAASGVKATSATLNGSVDPNGRATTWYFEYGTSTGYGSRTAARSASGTNAAPVAASVSGLQAGRTYHFHLVATSDGGTTNGADVTFTTSGAPTVSTSAASSIAPTAAKLNGTVNPNGLSTSWYFEYGTSTSYGTRTSAKAAGSGSSTLKESASISKLRPATVYHYRIVASNSAGTNAGADRTFSTAGPPAVQTGAAQGVGVTTATLTGAVNPESRSTSWWFEYGTSTAYGAKTSTQGAGSGAATRSVSSAIRNLVSGTVYHFRLVAKNDAGTTAGADGTFQTAGVTLTALTHQVVFGRTIYLRGAIPMPAAGQAVTVYAQPYGTPSFRSIAVVLTAADGSWAYLAKPTIATAYRAAWQGGTSAPVSIGVHPAIAFSRTGTHFHVRVGAGRTFAHRVVQLQRRTTAGRWLTIKRVRLGARSRVEFTAVLRRGRSTLRVAFSVNQAGAGYLGAKSRTLAVTRR